MVLIKRIRWNHVRKQAMADRKSQIGGTRREPQIAGRGCLAYPRPGRWRALRHDGDGLVPSNREKTCLRERKHGTRHHSNLPSFRYPIIPIFHRSIIPFFHHSIPRPLRPEPRTQVCETKPISRGQVCETKPICGYAIVRNKANSPVPHRTKQSQLARGRVCETKPISRVWLGVG